MKTLLSLIISGALVVSGYAQTRNVLVGTNNAVVQPTNFWSADASNARTGLGLGTSATNPSSAFQPSSATLSNLAAGNGVNLTNVTATIVGTSVSITNVSGLQAALDGKLATNGSAANLTSFPSGVLQTNSSLSLFPAGLLRTNGDGSGLTNLPVPALASNVLSTIAIEKGGTGATNAAGARTALGGTAVGTNLFTAVDAAAARSTLGVVGSAGGVVAISNGGSGASTAGGARTNLGLGALDNVVFNNVVAYGGVYGDTNDFVLDTQNYSLYASGSFAAGWDAGSWSFNVPFIFVGTNAASNIAASRTNLGLGWSGLTNTTASAFRNALEIGTTNTLTIAGLVAQNITIASGGEITLQSTLSNAGSFRTNIGLPWSGLTNSDAASFRTALSLGTAATNPASAFQPASSALTNLVSGNGGALTNLQATNIVGLIPTSNIPSIVLTSIGTITIQQGGTGATNAANARQNLGSTTVGDAVFIATNAAAARTVLGALSTSGDAINLTNFPTLLLRTNGNGAGLTNITAANITGTVALASNVTGTIAISNGGSGATTAGGARTNFGLVLTALTNTNADTFRAGIGLGGADQVEFLDVAAEELKVGTNIVVSLVNQELIDNGLAVLSWSTNGIDFFGSGVKAATRTNLGLGASWLTNTNNPVFVNTNGEVVSPTNFWQVAPIATLLQNSTPVVNATNAATNARLLFLFSLAPSTVGVTNTITLPTNGGTFNGDVATITHSGPTSSVTAVRQLGASTNIITLNQVDESVRFLYRNNQWTLMDNISYIEPIYFSGTNAAANAAASRTNLGLGATNDVTFQNVSLDGGQLNLSNGAIYWLGDARYEPETQAFQGDVSFENGSLSIVGTNAAAKIAATRTNLGLPLDALTNTSVTNFQKAIFYTNTAPSNIGGNLGTIAAWIEIVASNGVTYKIPAYTNVP